MVGNGGCLRSDLAVALVVESVPLEDGLSGTDPSRECHFCPGVDFWMVSSTFVDRIRWVLLEALMRAKRGSKVIENVVVGFVGSGKETVI